MENKYYEKARYDYMELVSIVESFNGSLEELCGKLAGFHLNSERFDLNYKTITTTIYYIDNKLFVYDYVDIWDDEKEIMIAECLNIKKIEVM